MLTKLDRLSKATILVVDDDALNRHLITTALEKSGFSTVKIAVDGNDALVQTIKFKPDLIILDLQMPNLDGFGFCRKVRNYDELPRMPIIVQTISEAREDKLRALSVGADDFLNKPLDMEELKLRSCVHLERYFMLQDLKNMCGYLKMELDLMHGAMRQIEKSNVSLQVVKNLNRLATCWRRCPCCPLTVLNA
jgi:DNA-binding response OmpR family regulator